MRNKEQDMERKNAAYDLRLRGKSYREIGRELGIGHGTAQRWVQEVCDLVVLPNVEAVRKQEVDRLMRYLDRLDERVEEGDDRAISLAIKISERLTKMLGVDMPTVTVVENHEVSELDLDIRRLIEAQNAANAAEKRRAAAKELSSGTGEGEREQA
jgi:transposase